MEREGLRVILQRFYTTSLSRHLIVFLHVKTNQIVRNVFLTQSLSNHKLVNNLSLVNPQK